MKLGIIGLPNVGKSTLFNSLTKAGAESANYPFCTIDPKVGVVAVPDERLDVLTKMYNSKSTVPAVIEFVDIAGLVRGASKGEGLGNQFLSHIREVDAIVHVVRCFEDTNIIHVEGTVDPARDIETIDLELIFADLDTIDSSCEVNLFTRLDLPALRRPKNAMCVRSIRHLSVKKSESEVSLSILDRNESVAQNGACLLVGNIRNVLLNEDLTRSACLGRCIVNEVFLECHERIGQAAVLDLLSFAESHESVAGSAFAVACGAE